MREWSLIVLLTVLLAVVGFAWGGAPPGSRRSPSWLGTCSSWVTRADPQGAFRLVASAYRYVTPPIVLAGLFLP